MKTIALMPVKNEAWILPQTLPILNSFCDVIIIGDQMSDDGSRDIYADYPKIIVIENSEAFHSNRIRWRLLDASRNFDGNNLIICCDADEAFPPKLFGDFIVKLDDRKHVGKRMLFPWIQLWKSLDYYSDDEVWHDKWMTAAFVDDRALDYERRFAVNDHSPRLPGSPDCPGIKVKDVPLLHFQWVAWEKTQVKQAYYCCAELIHDPSHPEAINATYSHAFEIPDPELQPVPMKWLEGIGISDEIAGLRGGWQLKEMMSWFDEYGVTYFEPLQIWHIHELYDEFVKRAGREPNPLRPPHARPYQRLRAAVKSRLRRIGRVWGRTWRRPA